MILDMFNSGPRYTEDELMARLKFIVGICLSLTLFGIVFVVLYSLVFVVQPLNAIAPIDQKFFELIIPIATFLTGTLSGIMLAGKDPDARKRALEAALEKPTISPPPAPKNEPSLKPLGPSPFGAPSGMSSGGIVPVSATAAPAPPEFKPAVTVGFGGKPAPTQPPQPEI
jgi:hypothetical protein